MLRSFLSLALVLACLAAPGLAQAPDDLVVTAGTVVPMSGAPISPGRVVIMDGRITAVGPVDKVAVPAGVRHVHQPDAVLTPGVIDAASHVGLRAHLDDTTVASLPDVRVSDVVEPKRDHLDKLLTLGITTSHLVPGKRNVVGGRTAIGRRGGRADFSWIVDDGALHASLEQGAWPRDLPPTSLVGALDHLNELRKRPGLAKLATRHGHLVLVAPGAREVDAAARLAKTWGSKPVIMIGLGGAERAATMAAHFAGVVLEPFGTNVSAPQARGLKALFAADVAVAFASRAPLLDPSALRLSAVAARAAGVPASQLWPALTADAAKLLGISEHVGALRPGTHGDCVLWSKEPTDPRARVLLVVQDGRTVAGSLNQEASR